MVGKGRGAVPAKLARKYIEDFNQYKISIHGPKGRLVPVLIDYCESSNIPYVVEVVPGQLITVRRLDAR